MLHLFEVASGLDSAVLGESEILGQVRTAWERARTEGAARAGLNLLFRHALEVGKRVRTETAIGRSTASVSYAAVAMATDRLGTLEGRRVLVVGAGDMGEGMAVALRHAGVGEMLVANRTVRRAVEVASRVDGLAVGLHEVDEALVDADVLLTSTGAGSVLFEHHAIAGLMERRPDRPLLIVDVAVPRDVDRGVTAIPGVTLLDLDDLRAFAERGRRTSAAARPPRPGPSPSTSSTATPSWPPPARPRRSSAGCTSGPSPCARPSWSATAASSTTSTTSSAPRSTRSPRDWSPSCCTSLRSG